MKPGDRLEGGPVELVASHHPTGDEMDAYERLLGDAMRGDQVLFAREDYVEEAWRIVAPILGNAAPVRPYEPGTWGPIEVDTLIAAAAGWHNPVVKPEDVKADVFRPEHAPMKIEVLDDADQVARQAASSSGRRGLARPPRLAGRFVVAVSGGTTPWQMLRALADEDVPWPNFHMFQVDERVAPPGDPDRNLTHLRESLLSHAPLKESQIHAMPVEDPDLAKAATSGMPQTLQKIAGSPPVFDLVHLGLGPDGHTASLVPGDPVLEIPDADVALTGIYQGRRRMTLTYPVLDRARQILWLVTDGAARPTCFAGFATPIRRSRPDAYTASNMESCWPIEPAAAKFKRARLPVRTLRETAGAANSKTTIAGQLNHGQSWTHLRQRLGRFDLEPRPLAGHAGVGDRHSDLPAACARQRQNGRRSSPAGRGRMRGHQVDRIRRQRTLRCEMQSHRQFLDCRLPFGVLHQHAEVGRTNCKQGRGDEQSHLPGAGALARNDRSAVGPSGCAKTGSDQHGKQGLPHGRTSARSVA